MLNITLARRTYKSYYDDETNLYVHKFDKEISKSANKTTKIARTVDETLLSAEINCSSKIFLILNVWVLNILHAGILSKQVFDLSQYFLIYLFTFRQIIANSLTLDHAAENLLIVLIK